MKHRIDWWKSGNACCRAAWQVYKPGKGVRTHSYSRQELAKQVFGTDNAQHPGVGNVPRRQELLLEGKVRVLGAVNTPLACSHLTPLEIRPKTQAWGDGCYYGRLFSICRDTSRRGQSRPPLMNACARSWSKTAPITDPQGRNLGSRAYRPKKLYCRVNAVPTDQIVYFGDLKWRSVGSVGPRSIYTLDNNTGPDEANHDWYGILILPAYERITPIFLQTHRVDGSPRQHDEHAIRSQAPPA